MFLQVRSFESNYRLSSRAGPLRHSQLAPPAASSTRLSTTGIPWKSYPYGSDVVRLDVSARFKLCWTVFPLSLSIQVWAAVPRARRSPRCVPCRPVVPTASQPPSLHHSRPAVAWTVACDLDTHRLRLERCERCPWRIDTERKRPKATACSR